MSSRSNKGNCSFDFLVYTFDLPMYILHHENWHLYGLIIILTIIIIMRDIIYDNDGYLLSTKTLLDVNRFSFSLDIYFNQRLLRRKEKEKKRNETSFDICQLSLFYWSILWLMLYCICVFMGCHLNTVVYSIKGVTIHYYVNKETSDQEELLCQFVNIIYLASGWRLS